jgi:hypothetical protein
VNFTALRGHLSSTKPPSAVQVDLELKALNIISWKRINDPQLFDGGIVGKKFYPEELIDNNYEDKMLAQKRFYLIRGGFLRFHGS